MYAAEFLLSRSLSYEQRKAKVEALIHELHLDVCADTVIGKNASSPLSLLVNVAYLQAMRANEEYQADRGRESALH